MAPINTSKVVHRAQKCVACLRVEKDVRVSQDLGIELLASIRKHVIRKTSKTKHNKLATGGNAEGLAFSTFPTGLALGVRNDIWFLELLQQLFYCQYLAGLLRYIKNRYCLLKGTCRKRPARVAANFLIPS